MTAPIKVPEPCQDAYNRDHRHTGEISVWLEVSDGKQRYYVLGTATSISDAVSDAEQHAFDRFGDDVSVFDWHAA